MQQKRPVNSTKVHFLNETGRPNSLGLRQRELSELLDQLDLPETPAKGVKRDFVRWPFRRTTIPLKVFHPNGTTAGFSVACRNISRGGLAFLHSAFLHQGTRCSVVLSHPTRGDVTIEGWVARCAHRSGMIHEIGMTFAEPIEVREFLSQDPLADCFSLEKIDPEQLQGALLIIAAGDTDQKILRHYLRATHLRISEVASSAAAVDRFCEHWDLIFIDLNLSGEDGAESVAMLRQCGYTGPIIATTSDISPEARQRLLSIEANAFLAKPLSQSLVLRAVAEFLIANRHAHAAATTTLTPDHPEFQLAESFAMSLRTIARKLEDCVRRADVPGCKALSLQVSGTAPSVGFTELGKLAANTAESLSKTMNVQDSIRHIRQLIAACERARVKKAA
jgi:CheY-like chemotaxis protein